MSTRRTRASPSSVIDRAIPASPLPVSRTVKTLRAVGLSLLLASCGGSASPGAASPSPLEVELSWAAYQLNAEPRFRLMFEGSNEVSRPSEVRLVLPSGASVASAPMISTVNDPLQLCGADKSPRPKGPFRATLTPSEQLFRDFIRQPADFRVEARVGDTWRPTRLTLLCHATE